MNFEKLEQLCAENDITLTQLERKLDLGNGTIRLWKNRKPLFENVAKVAKFFGVPMESLLKETNDDREVC